MGITGDQVLEDRKTDAEHKWEKQVLAFKQWLIDEKGYAEYTATASAHAAASFFAFHYHELKLRPSEGKRLRERTRKTEDYRFTREELKIMSEIGDLKTQYVVVAGKSFGLRVGDFLRLTRGDLEPYLDRPVPISIGEYATTKEKVKACPFIDADALPITRRMIRQMDIDERKAPTERILTLKSEIQLSNILKSAAAKAGIKPGNKIIRFHCLRKYLTDRLSSYMAESKWKQIVGKKVDEKAYVSPDLLRDDYARVMLDTCWTGIVAETDIEKRVKLEVLKMKAKELGFTDDDIQIKLTRMDLKEFAEWLAKQSQPTEEDCQKIVSEEELGGYLAKGWKVQAILPSGRIVVDNEQ
ncbi:MAG: hypothetical protein OEZ20_06870 [candidate division WOR-3 bacterium]|nr:hypothetical protein [candidate division WOR-3 bacterium]